MNVGMANTAIFDIDDDVVLAGLAPLERKRCKWSLGDRGSISLGLLMRSRFREIVMDCV